MLHVLLLMITILCNCYFCYFTCHCSSFDFVWLLATQNYVAMMIHHVVHESFKNNILKRFMNHMMSHHRYLIKIKFLH